ncbi:leucyl aminopeptidase family protein [Cellulosimicrobium composti]|uniref:Probable cytosol aminopeptidase n=1 Tax=Cellulosimicrobium composti TaxID=2672572 RepID=A0ABX0BB64_9MICO|nr:leucyl aminopeptidase family protein [Cellulosimicrobium composti]NDO89452.1 leucyl aminopeptidase family protein [Cellulosimicrobium composti]
MPARDRRNPGTPTPGRTPPEVVGARGRLSDAALLDDAQVDAVVVAVAPPREADDGLQPRSGTIDATLRYGVDLAELAERAGGPGFRGASGEVVRVDLPRVHAGSTTRLPWAGLPPRLLLLGVGSGTALDLRRAGAALARASRGLDRVVSAATADAGPEGVRAFVEGYQLAAYTQPRRTAAEKGADAEAPAAQLVLLTPEDQPDVTPSVEAASRAAEATWLVRDLANTPSDVKDPAWFADRAAELADGLGLDVTVRGPAELEREGFGAIRAVGGGSARPPRLVTLTYDPADHGVVAPGTAARHVVVVGKGITYDSGGLSIKPREAMVPMKTDMAGAAVALAVVLGAARARSDRRVTAVLPLAENHVGAASYRPGDVVRTWSGRTVEVANTDAEGRLVLADAIGYAVRDLAPDVLVDVATLTGAATLGLGRGHAALFATDDDVAGAIEDAAATTGERVWRMPLVEDYASALRSEVADLRHVPAENPGGGAITAALFLREFAGDVPWAHLDVAGPARATADRHEVVTGATGFGARLLLEALGTL